VRDEGERVDKKLEKPGDLRGLLKNKALFVFSWERLLV